MDLDPQKELLRSKIVLINFSERKYLGTFWSSILPGDIESQYW